MQFDRSPEKDMQEERDSYKEQLDDLQRALDQAGERRVLTRRFGIDQKHQWGPADFGEHLFFYWCVLLVIVIVLSHSHFQRKTRRRLVQKSKCGASFSLEMCGFCCWVLCEIALKNWLENAGVEEIQKTK